MKSIKSWLAVLLACLVIYRPFCRYLCPLGAIYGLFNPVAIFRYRIDAENCIHCGSCSRACPMAIDAEKEINSAECIRCGACRAACPAGCIHIGSARGTKEGSLTEQRLSMALAGTQEEEKK